MFFSDARIFDRTSNFANFELYENNSTEIPAKIISIWADSKAYETRDGVPIIPSEETLIDSDLGYINNQLADCNNAKTGYYLTTMDPTNAPHWSIFITYNRLLLMKIMQCNMRGNWMM